MSNNDLVGTCRLVLPNNSRYRDWTLWTKNGNLIDLICYKNRALIPYNFKHLSPAMYISGGFWFASRKIMLEYPLNENLFAGEAEDLEWSFRVRKSNTFYFLDNTSVKLLKNNLVFFIELQGWRLFVLKHFFYFLNSNTSRTIYSLLQKNTKLLNSIRRITDYFDRII